MKALIGILLIGFALLLGGCAAGEDREPAQSASGFASIPAGPEEEAGSAGETDDPPVSEAPEPVWKPYAEKYGAEYGFTDIYLPERVWLIGEENIVQLLLFDGAETVTVIRRSALERVESLALSTEVTLRAYDKTMNYILIMVTAEDAEAILALLQ